MWSVASGAGEYSQARAVRGVVAAIVVYSFEKSSGRW